MKRLTSILALVSLLLLGGRAQAQSYQGNYGIVTGFSGGTLSAPLLGIDGTQSAVMFGFAGAPNTGMYRTSGTNIGFSVNGALGLVITATAIAISNLVVLDATGGNLAISGPVIAADKITSTRTTDLGWSVVSAANQACNTTCTSACVVGFDGGTSNTPVACTDATADKCLCAGSS